MVEVVIALKREQEDGTGEEEEQEEAEKVVKRRRKKACDPHKKRACVDCTKRCARIHGRVSPSSSKARPVPSFFKVMVGYFSENMVRILGLFNLQLLHSLFFLTKGNNTITYAKLEIHACRRYLPRLPRQSRT